jgi:hypothetical protein
MTDNADRFDLKEILLESARVDTKFGEKTRIIKAYTIGVDYATSPAVNGRAKYVWVRESGMNGAVHQVFNPDKIPLLVEFPCLITYSPRRPYRWEIYGTDWDTVYNYPSYTDQSFGIGTHAPNHEWPDGAPGTDPLNVYPRALAPLRTYAGTGLSVNVWMYRYWHNTTIREFVGISNYSLAAYQPAAGYAVRVLVYLDMFTSSVMSVAGTVIGDSEIVIPPNPMIPTDAVLSAFVRLDGSQTSFSESDMTDLRLHLTDTSLFDVNSIMTDDEAAIMVDANGNVMVES